MVANTFNGIVSQLWGIPTANLMNPPHSPKIKKDELSSKASLINSIVAVFKNNLSKQVKALK